MEKEETKNDNVTPTLHNNNTGSEKGENKKRKSTKKGGKKKGVSLKYQPIVHT